MMIVDRQKARAMKGQDGNGIATLALAGAALMLLAGPTYATDSNSAARLRLAAVSTSQESSRPALRDAERTHDAWRLVQSTATGPEGAADRTTILAAFASATPESVEEELAQQHGLEIVKRVTLSSLDLRVVTYRTRDGHATAVLVQRLRADPRVNSAQVNMAYRPVDPDETEVSVSENPRIVGRRGAKASAPVAKRAAESRPATLDTAGQQPKPKLASNRISMRRANVTAADVLAGGL